MSAPLGAIGPKHSGTALNAIPCCEHPSMRHPAFAGDSNLSRRFFGLSREVCQSLAVSLNRLRGFCTNAADGSKVVSITLTESSMYRSACQERLHSGGVHS